jgi:hypothetical protein
MDNTLDPANGFQPNLLPVTKSLEGQGVSWPVSQVASMVNPSQFGATMSQKTPRQRQEVCGGTKRFLGDKIQSYNISKRVVYVAGYDMTLNNCPQQLPGDGPIFPGFCSQPQGYAPPFTQTLPSPKKRSVPYFGLQEPHINEYHHLERPYTSSFNSMQYQAVTTLPQSGGGLPFQQIHDVNISYSAYEAQNRVNLLSKISEEMKSKADDATKIRQNFRSYTPPRMKQAKRRVQEPHMNRELSSPPGMAHSSGFEQDTNATQRPIDGEAMALGFGDPRGYGSSHPDMEMSSMQSKGVMMSMSPYSRSAETRQGSAYPEIIFEDPSTPKNFKHPRRTSDPIAAAPPAKRQKVGVGRASKRPIVPTEPQYIPAPCSGAPPFRVVPDSASASAMPYPGSTGPSILFPRPAVQTGNILQSFGVLLSNPSEFTIVPRPSAFNDTLAGHDSTQILAEQVRQIMPSVENDVISIAAVTPALEQSKIKCLHGTSDGASIRDGLPPGGPWVLPGGASFTASHVDSSPVGGGYHITPHHVGHSILGEGEPINPDDAGSSIIGEGEHINPEKAVPLSSAGGGGEVIIPALSSLGEQNDQSIDQGPLEDLGFFGYALDGGDFAVSCFCFPKF